MASPQLYENLKLLILIAGAVAMAIIHERDVCIMLAGAAAGLVTQAQIVATQKVPILPLVTAMGAGGAAHFLLGG